MRSTFLLAGLIAAFSASAGVSTRLSDAASVGLAALKLQHDQRAAVRAALQTQGTRSLPRSPGRDELDRMYASRDFRPLWLDANALPNAAAREALSLLADAPRHGLDPMSYDLPALSRAEAALRLDPGSVEHGQPPGFDLRLTAAMLSYLRHLHVGRVDPDAVRFKIPSRAHEHDYGALLQAAVEGGYLRQAAEDLAPAFAQYSALQAALAKYRLLASDGTMTLLPAVQASLKPGDSYPEAEALARRLVTYGDLAPGEVPAGAQLAYTRPLAEAVMRFQRRHGLADDGVLGKATIAALNVPMAARVRQIELAMERLRWLPHANDQPFVAINIPAFRLWARDAGNSVEMAVIVGRAMSTQTPVFIDEMTHLIFRPYWNVPTSIVRQEILPALRRDPGYLQRQGMEIVKGLGDDAPVMPPDAENIALLRQGVLRLRQRPGPANSLGLVKFVFPNDANVYMHDTPARQLFSRSRRDFSHGCIRLEDPTALAQWALHDQRDWTRERILAAMQGSKSLRVNLTRPVKVVLFYVTATVDPRDGSVRFNNDIYGHDATLERALASAPNH